ncbi:MAG TPA: putative zinc-binding metallopeptidase [Spirochaetota bacterium]|nr:putative zinc-binding metallopeptidase [Spirochaetota bacterium]
MLVSLFPVASIAAEKVDFSKQLIHFEKRYGLSVRYEIGEGFFPPEWLEAPISAQATAIPENEIKRTLSLATGALRIYPDTVVKKHLRAIHLAGGFTFYGLNFGATSADDCIYLCNAGTADGYTDRYILRAFHHEFAHILYAKHVFPLDEWSACNPPGFAYLGGNDGGVEAIRKGADSLVGDERLYGMGFLAEYAMSSPEEDLCVYSEMILGAGEEFAGIMNRHNAVKRKYAIWRKYYLSIDPAFMRTVNPKKPR